MAVKFSQFTQENTAANVTELVGYTASGNLNVRIGPDHIDTVYAYATAQSTNDVDLTLTGTKTGTSTTTDTIKFTAGSNITLTEDGAGGGFTIANTATYSSWNLAGDSGTPQAISDGNSATFSSANAAITTAAGATDTLTITSVAFTGGANIGHVPSAAAASAGQFLDYQGNWSAPSGAFTGFNITDGVTTEVVGNGDIVTFAGGTYINTAVTATDTVTITLDTTVALWTLAGGDGAGPTQSITPGNTVTIKENTSTTVNSVIVGGGVQSLAANTDELLLDQKSEQVITVAGSVYVVDGASQPTIVLPRGFTYEFNQDDSSNNSHPIVIGTAAASSPYTTGIQYYGSTSANTLTPVTQSDYANSTNFNSYATRRVRLRITQNTPALYYYCSVHGASYGGSIAYGGATGLATKTVDQVTISNATTGTVALSVTPTSEAYTDMYVSGVYQNKSVYSLSGSTITLDSSAYFPNGSIVEVVSTT
jgi:Fe-S cluster assembly iron-binding protein IscA